MNAPWWEEDLERLRQEQNPGKYIPTQPAMRLPKPNPLDMNPHPDEEDDKKGTVFYIDM